MENLNNFLRGLSTEIRLDIARFLLKKHDEGIRAVKFEQILKHVGETHKMLQPGVSKQARLMMDCGVLSRTGRCYWQLVKPEVTRTILEVEDAYVEGTDAWKQDEEI